ncbi:Flp pilus assembly protein TadG [Rhizobium sp. RU20A]|uniref:TadE/TadG family type IV pilus assembly protein n=1 Tax=Rhizobium sp. RU20A TaxID=1907412 RepID=UPI00095517FF|nr:pilus assembly protein [Rhizobium sp. RU20A]SIP99057.1 Flp pilus assembly protein TadG [Rhizobium sp. RU20A]
MMNVFSSFFTCKSGNFAILYAAIVPMVMAGSLAVIDFSRATSVKAEAQGALDSTMLQLAITTTSDTQGLEELGARTMLGNQMNIGGTLVSSSFSNSEDGLTVKGLATFSVPSLMRGFFHNDSLTVTVSSDVKRSAKNVEVALVLDTTASMAGQRIADLKVAAKDLVDIVVTDRQTPTYSKVALVPYSMAVNVGTYADAVRGTISNGTCNTPGCNQFLFTNANGNKVTFGSSTCVSERTGPESYTDAPPSTKRLGYNYPSSANPCIASTIQPLSDDKAAIKSSIEALSAGGSTGGHIGVAWGWYMVSPKFSYLFPTARQAGPYNTEKTKKIVILMTDGEYNSAYCDGVIARNSLTGSGASSQHINCDAPNGGAYEQAQALCTSMKAAGVTVYTVGLELVNTQAARDLIAKCATSERHVYYPNSGTALKEAFRNIGRDISGPVVSR